MNRLRSHLRSILGWASVIVLLGFPLFSVSGALSMFIKIGTLVGESTGDANKLHAGEIDVLAWSWGMSNSGTVTGGSGTANVQDFSFTKNLDKSSPALMLATLQGSSFPEAKLTVSRAIGTNASAEFLFITLTDVLVTSVSTGGSGDQTKLTENVTLNFGKFKLEYQQFDSAGKTVGARSVIGWNVITGTKE
jgi:type VI secretion system secreted protein Hcp